MCGAPRRQHSGLLGYHPGLLRQDLPAQPKYHPGRVRGDRYAIHRRAPAGTIRFSNVDADDWFYTQVTGVAQYGWIGGFSDGMFRHYALITREQVTAIINRMLGRSADPVHVDRRVDELRQSSDVEETYWAYYAVMEATNGLSYDEDSGTESWTGLR